jgi:YidC/Oxa1 family membrane protein insertase
MFDLIATLLAWFYELVPDYAFAIAMLTLTVMLVLAPLNLRFTKTQLEMQRLAPELKRIQAEYRNDRQKMNEEVMKLYSQHKVNPIGGCLPLLLQLPVLFILYRVLDKMTRTCQDAAQIAAGECAAVGNFRPSYLDQSSQLFKDLIQTDQMRAFGFDFARTPIEVLSDSVVRGLPYLAMVLVMAGTSYIQQWQITLRSKSTGQPVNKQQQMILRVLPAVFAVFSLNFPAGLIWYWIVQNLFRIALNAYITKRFYGGDIAAGIGDTSPVAGRTVVDTTATEATGRPAPRLGRHRGAAAARPEPSRPAPAKPSGAKPGGAKPSEGKPSGGKSGGAKPGGAKPSGGKPSGGGSGGGSSAPRPKPGRTTPRQPPPRER